MKKIFKYGLLAVTAMITVSSAAFAQVMPPMPPLPPLTGITTPKENQEFTQKMNDLKIKMQVLQKQMAMLSAAQQKSMFNGMKGFSEKFKDFGKNFSGSFNGMVPDINNNFKTFNNNLIYDDYKKRVLTGEIIEKTKNYSKTYAVDGNDVLQINNKFGSITVNIWNRNEFKVDVQMKFGSDDEETVNELINGSGITDSKTGSIVAFKTNIYHSESKKKANNQHIEFNYTVYMPAGNPIDFHNEFGKVSLPDLAGKVTLRLQFGSLVAQQLNNSQNDVQLKFFQDNTSTIAAFNGGKLKVEFSKLKIGLIDNVDADFGFSTVVIDRLKNSADMNIKYGSGFNVGVIDRSVKNLNITASFTKVNLDFKESQNFNFDVTTSMGNFNYNDDKVKVTSKSPSDDEPYSSTKSYKGYIGKNNTNGNIVINAKFTNVRFN